MAPTFTGMGRSDRRAVYRFQQFVREAREAARAGGAFAGGPPVVVGHSFGGARCDGPGARVRTRASPRPRPRRSPPLCARKTFARRARRGRRRSASPHPSLESLVERFYLAPPQLCENLYILDFLARRSAREVVDDHGRRGWELSFDRAFWDRFERVDTAPLLAGARCPLALIRGAEFEAHHCG